MSRHPFLSTVVVSALLAGSAVTLADSTDHALEPCLNGEVSATGLFPSQAAEDAHHRERAGTGDQRRGVGLRPLPDPGA